MHEDDVSAMVSDFQRANAFLIKRKPIVEGSSVCVAYRREWLIKAAVQEFACVSREQLGVRLLVSRSAAYSVSQTRSRSGQRRG